mmetsp:Transcript_76539/g.128572  ORF Transcript_76539/g.128572 Transcript_76539/m.128572 type:complete len:306 (+) Transcript_76539:1009-1926(+)
MEGANSKVRLDLCGPLLCRLVHLLWGPQHVPRRYLQLFCGHLQAAALLPPPHHAFDPVADLEHLLWLLHVLVGDARHVQKTLHAMQVQIRGRIRQTCHYCLVHGASPEGMSGALRRLVGPLVHQLRILEHVAWAGLQQLGRQNHVRGHMWARDDHALDGVPDCKHVLQVADTLLRHLSSVKQATFRSANVNEHSIGLDADHWSLYDLENIGSCGRPLADNEPLIRHVQFKYLHVDPFRCQLSLGSGLLKDLGVEFLRVAVPVEILFELIILIVPVEAIALQLPDGIAIRQESGHLFKSRNLELPA